MAESIKEEKKRKQMEAIADDLFNNDKVCIAFPFLYSETSLASKGRLIFATVVTQSREDDVVHPLFLRSLVVVNRKVMQKSRTLQL